jgi:hypothetical protein
MTFFVWLIVALAMVLYGFGDYLSKLYSNTGSNWLAIWAVLLYSVVSVLWLVALKEYNSLSILGTVWSVLYAIVSIGVAIIAFHEPLVFRQIVGICLGILSIYFLST